MKIHNINKRNFLFAIGLMNKQNYCFSFQILKKWFSNFLTSNMLFYFD